MSCLHPVFNIVKLLGTPSLDVTLEPHHPWCSSITKAMRNTKWRPSWTAACSKGNFNTWYAGKVTDTRSTRGSIRQMWKPWRLLQSSITSTQAPLRTFKLSMRTTSYLINLVGTLGPERGVVSEEPHFSTLINSSQLQSLLRQVCGSGYLEDSSNILDLHFLTTTDNVHSLPDCAYHKQYRYCSI